MHHILDCFARYPRINQPYIWTDSVGEKGGTIPAADPTDKGAHYELTINIKEKQLKDLIEVVRKDWKSAIETGKVTKDNAAKCNDPKNLMKIEKQADKTYDVACKIKNYDADCKPLQFAADKQKLPDDFELTDGSHIHIGVQCYFYQKGKGLHIQPKKLRVVQLAERKPRKDAVDDFEAEAAPIDPDADDFDAPQETVTFGEQQATVGGNASQDFDDEIPF